LKPAAVVNLMVQIATQDQLDEIDLTTPLEIKPASEELMLCKTRNPPALLDTESSQFRDGIFAVGLVAIAGRDHDAFGRRTSVEPVKEPTVGVDEMLQ
jgi:hypothetical protein